MKHLRIGEARRDVRQYVSRNRRYYSIESAIKPSIMGVYDHDDDEFAVVEGNRLCVMSMALMKELHDIYEDLEYLQRAEVRIGG